MEVSLSPDEIETRSKTMAETKKVHPLAKFSVAGKVAVAASTKVGVKHAARLIGRP